MVDIATKKCTVCNTVKSEDEFYTQRANGKEYLKSECKTCSIASTTRYILENSGKNKQYKKNWIANNKEEVNQYHRDYYSLNKEKNRLYNTVYQREYRRKKAWAIKETFINRFSGLEWDDLKRAVNSVLKEHHLKVELSLEDTIVSLYVLKTTPIDEELRFKLSTIYLILSGNYKTEQLKEKLKGLIPHRWGLKHI